MWQYTGTSRPPFADKPGRGQESVWDFPRPPRLEQRSNRVLVRWRDLQIAQTTRALRVCETAAPPTWYVPPADVTAKLVAIAGHSMCEWKGTACYWALADDATKTAVAWSYPRPLPAFIALTDYLGFYPARVACAIDGETVRPQPGQFYGGWITADLAGPFKGAAGSEWW